MKKLSLKSLSEIKGSGNTTTQTVTLGSIRIIRNQFMQSIETEVAVDQELEISY
ncbi:hypothetical protein [Myroides pelagicus]|uniref:Uncharacterized protein n=1 Tax=Myroides pelagicus TaxID=270914 RepID=A0A7K1GSN1_9FLAO|nr:hypothetical protein [Myroides pelagicus]MTH31013.1 hypothetical protein [Myroides pelagicus]